MRGRRAAERAILELLDQISNAGAFNSRSFEIATDSFSTFFWPLLRFVLGTVGRYILHEKTNDSLLTINFMYGYFICQQNVLKCTPIC